jgi:hypothetical protein
MNKKAGGEEKTDILNEVNRVPMSEEGREKMTLNIYDLQYLVRLQDMSNDAFREELREIYEADNASICKSVVNEVSKTLAEVLAPFYEQMSMIANDIKDIKVDVLNIRNRLHVIEVKQADDESKIVEIVSRLDKKKVRIEELEAKILLLQPEPIEELVKEVHGIRPSIIKLIKTQKWFNIAFRIAIAVTISTIIALLIHYNLPYKYELKPEQRVEIITK